MKNKQELKNTYFVFNLSNVIDEYSPYYGLQGEVKINVYKIFRHPELLRCLDRTAKKEFHKLTDKI